MWAEPDADEDSPGPHTENDDTQYKTNNTYL